MGHTAMPCAVYVAAPLGAAHLATWVADELVRRGFDVVSRWHRWVGEAGQTSDPVDDTAREHILESNLEDLNRADVVVALTQVGTPRATFCEIAWALGNGLPVVWVSGPQGAGRCIFDAHRLVRRVVLEAGMGMLSAIEHELAAVQALGAA